MAGLKQSKRVSWPTDGSLCKVRLFLSEDAPSQSGLGAQDHLQAKAAWLLHAAGLVDSDDSLPPGFEAPHKYRPEIEISKIPIINWQCPPRLFLDPEWRVVAGEESEEVDLENQREPGVLEAIYPRPSSIPLNPFGGAEVQAAHVDDSCTPLIPITAIEEEDGTDQQNTFTPPNSAPMQLHSLPNAGTQHSSTPDIRFALEQLNSQSNVVTSMPNLTHSQQSPLASVMPTTGPGPAPSAEPDVIAAASAAFTAIMRSSEEGSLIDRDLLIKILSNPVMVEKLVSEYGAPKRTPSPLPVVNTSVTPSHQTVVIPPPAPSRQSVVTTPAASSPQTPSQIALSVPLSAPPSSHIFHAPKTVMPPALNMHPPPPMSHPPRPKPIAPPPKTPVPPTRDASYYKSLIQLHGGDKPENFDQKPMQFGNLSNPLDYHNNITGVSNGGDAIGVGVPNQRDMKPKVLKPCAYFNTPRGCRHGASCLYLHDAASNPQGTERHKETSKRIKLDRGIAGSN